MLCHPIKSAWSPLFVRISHALESVVFGAVLVNCSQNRACTVYLEDWVS